MKMNFIQKYFAIIVIAGVILAISIPSIFIPLKPYITYLLAAFIIGKLFGLSLTALIGLVIVGACPGGTASGVMALLARANISLVVSLTFLTTLLAPIFMPLIIYFSFQRVLS